MGCKPCIEVPLFLVFFAIILSDSITSNLIIYRTCYVTLHYNESSCALLGKNYSDNATKILERKVQPFATNILMTLSFVQAFIPPILCFFFGPWTDLYGRKPVILLSIAGSTISFLILMILSALPYATPWLFVLILIPHCFCGGFATFIAAIFCYVTDVTDMTNRGVKMGIVEGILCLAVALSTFSSSYILNYCGYVILYSICFGFALLGWLYAYFFIPESIQNIRKEGKFANLFRLSLVKETTKTIFKKRENYGRALLLTIFPLMTIALISVFGNSAVISLYLREQFQWTLEKYTLFSGVTGLLLTVGGVIGIYILHKLMHLKEIFVILIGLVFSLCSYLYQAFADTDWKFYAAGALKLPSGATGPMVRCLLSKLVPVEDAGKVFAVLTTFEVLSSVLGSSIFTYIYKCTMQTYPTAFNFVTAGLISMQIILVLIMMIIQRQQSQVSYQSISTIS